MTFTQTVRQFLIENPVFNDFAFRCQTFEEAEILVKALYNLGYYFEKGKPYDKDLLHKRWNVKKENTCLAIGSLNTTDPKIMFTGRMGMYVNQGRVIVNVSTLMEMSETGNISNVSTTDTDDTKICPNCGNLVNIKAKFCTNCGEKFEVVIEPEPTQTTNAEVPVAEDVPATEEIPAEETVPVTEETSNTAETNEKTEELVEEVVASETETQTPKITEPEPLEETKITQEKEQVVSDTPKETLVEETVQEVKDEQQETEAEPVETVQVAEVENVSDTTEDNTQKQIPVLCEILGLMPFQPFRIKNDYYFAENYIYRINDKGVREKKVGANLWFTTNDEQELEYIIEHKNQILVMEG